MQVKKKYTLRSSVASREVSIVNATDAKYTQLWMEENMHHKAKLFVSFTVPVETIVPFRCTAILFTTTPFKNHEKTQYFLLIYYHYLACKELNK